MKIFCFALALPCKLLPGFYLGEDLGFVLQERTMQGNSRHIEFNRCGLIPFCCGVFCCVLVRLFLPFLHICSMIMFCWRRRLCFLSFCGFGFRLPADNNAKEYEKILQTGTDFFGSRIKSRLFACFFYLSVCSFSACRC